MPLSPCRVAIFKSPHVSSPNPVPSSSLPHNPCTLILWWLRDAAIMKPYSPDKPGALWALWYMQEVVRFFGGNQGPESKRQLQKSSEAQPSVSAQTPTIVPDHLRVNPTRPAFGIACVLGGRQREWIDSRAAASRHCTLRLAIQLQESLRALPSRTTCSRASFLRVASTHDSDGIGSVRLLEPRPAVPR